MIIDTINIGGVLIPYNDIRNYRLINREFLFRPMFRKASSFPFKKYEFVQMIPFCAILSENEYNALSPSKSRLSRQAIDNIDTAKSLAIDFVTKGSIVQNIALNAADAALGFAFDTAKSAAKKITSKGKFYCLDRKGNVFRTTINSIPSLLASEIEFPIEITKAVTKHMLPSGYDPEIKQGLALHITTRFQNYLFFGYGIHINDPQQMYEKITQDLAIRRML